MSLCNWSSDVCSSDLSLIARPSDRGREVSGQGGRRVVRSGSEEHVHHRHVGSWRTVWRRRLFWARAHPEIGRASCSERITITYVSESLMNIQALLYI